MTVSSHDLFRVFVAIHIATGAVGAIAFWVPIATRKGSRLHRLWGKWFARLMLITACVAAAMATTTLYSPIETHPHLAHVAGFSDASTIRGIFGWMMLYLAILTINLVWQGWLCAAPTRSVPAIRAWHNVAAQVILLAVALNCAIQGLAIGQFLMVAISMVGFATVATNVWFMAKPAPSRSDWQREHVKAIVGAGISVYTAFFAFGAVRLMPQLALNPLFWAIPLITGVSMIIWFQRAISQKEKGLQPVPGQ